MKKFIAYFDILGYGERIKEKNIDEEYVIQESLINEVKKIIKENARKRADFHTISFSDTHIFYTNDISENAFEMIIKSSLVFMLIAAVRKPPYLPLRGVVNYGDFKADYDKAIFIGKGLREAYKLEKKQEWMGCFLTDSCYEQVKNFNTFKEFLQKFVLINYPVPLKVGSKNQYVINMESFPRIWGKQCKDMPLTTPEFIENIFINKGITNEKLRLNESAKKKLENTKKFFIDLQKITSENS